MNQHLHNTTVSQCHMVWNKRCGRYEPPTTLCCLQVEVGKEKKARYCSYQRGALVLGLIFLIFTLGIFTLGYLWTLNQGKVEVGKEKKARYRSYQRGALILGLIFLILTLGIFTLRYLWTPNQGKVYDHQYKAMLDGMEIDSVMEIDPSQRIEIFRMGNGSEEVLEVHDFKNGITGIRFAQHQRCYIKTQTRKLPTVTEVETEDTELLMGDTEGMDVRVEDSQVWVPAEEPIASTTFLLNSRIWEICQELPIHWIHPAPLRDAEMQEGEEWEATSDTQVTGKRSTRDVMDQLPVNDYRDIGLELDNRLDEQGYCCQYCRHGNRVCRRYHEPLGGFNPWPYYYQGGRVICQIVMPCNWWIARMLGRI